ncbi:NAD(P)-dependent alcohol dehydrogenase [Mucilaginibacter sp. KACC 22773]|uniref:NAD(P)-dependent alcohol dehydrogenase n=1 Tax=Mucilaginibacter sp. KACC 22773 TaxID=3025671 RepID=UPI002365148E|nr:NAD(P)-dependent alcohol dehydrogenase [Mucilaginibacter sp. KACC 22773]WDF77224.1 NAD(P)-dependent alcohol dehydrogenase [Mucilaginibacter sp. KACC 22773]
MENDKSNQENNKKREMGRRDFLTASAISTAGLVAGGLFFPPSADAQTTKKNSTGVSSRNGSGPFATQGMAAYSPDGPLKLMTFERRALGPKDIAIKLHYCGVCHSDIHTVHEDWGKIQFPQIVGHELAGEVVAVGSSASKFTVGARVGVGSMVNSCRHCSECQAGHENYCLNGNTQTYGSKDRDGSITQGGYSTFVVVDEDFVIDIPDAMDLAEAGPLLCAGITVYSPLLRWGVTTGMKVAILGMGGLGHIAVKLAKALGAEVTVFTTSPDKVEDAKRFGAANVVINKEGADYAAYKNSFDFALDTIPYKHNIKPFIPLLKRDAVFCRVGVGKVTDDIETGQMSLVLFRNAIAGSNTGGIRETQDMVNFCALNNIKPEIIKIPMHGINDAWQKVFDKKARYRYVIDVQSV